MDQLKRNIKIIIGICLIIIVVCIIAIYLVNKKSNDTSNDNEDIVGEEDVEYTTEKLRDATQFFTIQKCIQDNIDQTFIAKDMNVLNGDYISNYAVYGQITKENNVRDVYCIFRIDLDNMTYKIETIESGKYSDISKIDLRTNLTEIENNGKNSIEYTTIKNEDMCRIYYQNFTKIEVENPEQAYKLLDEQYRNERFPSFEDYKEYVNSYKNIIQAGALTKYSVDYKDDYTEYTIVDNYNNYYILKETSIMNYTIMLDSYTIKSDEYNEKYEALEDSNKVQANVYVFLQMINTKDYKHAYDLLDATYKQNNFDTLEKFKQFVNNNFFEYNLNSSSEIKIEQQGQYYVYSTVLRSDSSSAAEKKNLTVIMKLNEGTDFVMSFNI